MTASDAFSPAAIVLSFEFHGDGTVGIDRLFTCPGDRLFYTTANLKLGRKIDLAAGTFRNQERRLPDSAATYAFTGILLPEAVGRVELSGVTLETVRTIAMTGVDRIAVGALTHSATALDIGLDIEAP